MKAFYDKIILAVGVIALAGSGAYYATQQAEVEASVTKTPFGENYENLTADQFESSAAVWVDPVAQDDDGRELYDVFTPPKIWWDEATKTFIFQPPKEDEPIPPFGFRFVSIERELFRVQLEAYFEALSGNFDDATVSLFNYETNQAFRGKVGDRFPEHQVEIMDFVVEKVVDEQGLISRVPSVTIKDEVSGENIVLTTAERLYIPNSYFLKFETLPPYPSRTIEWEDAGQSEEVGDVTFKLLDFDFDNQSASIEKTFADDTPTETKTLTVAPASTASPESTVDDLSPEENEAQDENSSVFDSFFQN